MKIKDNIFKKSVDIKNYKICNLINQVMMTAAKSYQKDIKENKKPNFNKQAFKFFINCTDANKIVYKVIRKRFKNKRKLIRKVY